MTCKDCIHSGLCYKENDYENFPDRCGEFISDKILEKRPKGEWLKIDDGFYKDIKKFKCSECGREVIIIFDEDLITKYPFCHCGAKMTKEGDEE